MPRAGVDEHGISIGREDYAIVEPGRSLAPLVFQPHSNTLKYSSKR